MNLSRAAEKKTYEQLPEIKYKWSLDNLINGPGRRNQEQITTSYFLKLFNACLINFPLWLSIPKQLKTRNNLRERMGSRIRRACFCPAKHVEGAFADRME